MNTLVVFFAVVAAACGSLVPLAQPPHHPALVLDPHGRPLDTAEVINARALHLQAKALEGHYAPLAHAAVVPYAHSVVAPAVLAAPSAVSHQSRVDVHSSPAIVSHSVVAPVVAHSAYASPLLAHSAYGSPLLAHSALGHAGHGHYLKKRSLGHLAYAAPVVAHVAPSAVSHQSRVDVISSPAVVSHAVAPVVSHAYAAPVVAHAAPVLAVAPSAVSHQSRVDVRTSPAVVSHAVSPLVHAAPVYAASAYAAPAYGYAAHGAHGYSAYGAHAGLALSHAHLLKKRSLAHYAVPVVHTVPSAVSHQSRVDVISKPAVVATYAHAAPAVYAAPAAVYAAPAVSHFAPIAHSAVWSAPHHLSAALW